MLLLISYSGLERDSADEAGERQRALQTQVNERSFAHLRPLPGEAQWLVETDEDVDTWAHRLQALLAPEDRLLIVRVQGRTNGWLPSEAWDWINPRADGGG